MGVGYYVCKVHDWQEQHSLFPVWTKPGFSRTSHFPATVIVIEWSCCYRMRFRLTENLQRTGTNCKSIANTFVYVLNSRNNSFWLCLIHLEVSKEQLWTGCWAVGPFQRIPKQHCLPRMGGMDEHDWSIGIDPKRLEWALQGGDGTRLV